MNIQELRVKYPEYNDMDDETLARSFHKKFYSDLDFDDFSGRIGHTPKYQTIRPERGIADKVADTIATSDTARKVILPMQGVSNATLNPFGYIARASGIGTRPITPETATERALEGIGEYGFDAAGGALAGQAALGAGLLGSGVGRASKVARFLAKPAAMPAEIAAGVGAGGLTGAVNPESTLGKLGTGLAGGIAGGLVGGLTRGTRAGARRLMDTMERSIVPDVAQDIAQDVAQAPVKAARQAKAPTGKVKSSRLTSAERLAQNPNLPRAARAELADSVQYEQISNEALIQNAARSVSREPEKVKNRLLDKKVNLTAQDFEDARQLSSRFFSEGRDEDALRIIREVSERGTEAGQKIQALSLWSKMTPDGAVLNAERMIKQYNQQFGKNIKMTPDQAQKIRLLQERAMTLPDGDVKDVFNALSLKAQRELIPAGAGEKLKTARIMSMLLNTKTLLRNIEGNTAFAGVEQTLTGATAAGVDRILSQFTGQRTRALPQMGEYVRGLGSGAKKGARDALLGINTRQLGGKYDLQPAGAFKGVVGRTLEKALALGLQAPDRAFYEAAYRESIANQMKAQGLKRATKQIEGVAEKEALESVYQNKGIIGDAVLGLRRGLNKLSHEGLRGMGVRVSDKALGAGDLIMPFAQVPANLAQQGINYSPFGLLKGIGSLATGNQRQASKDIARAIVGTGGMAGGYGLARSGLLTGDMNPSNLSYKQALERRKNLELLGIRPNQLGGVSFSQIEPLGAMLTAGAKFAENGSTKDAAIASAEGIMEMPMMQGVSRLVKNTAQKGVGEALLNEAAQIPASFVPTASSQIADVVDDTIRETYDPNIVKRGLNVSLNKIPFARSLLPERKNVLGESQRKYDSEGLGLVFDAMINPNFVNERKSQPVIEELNRLYETTGNANQFLPVVDKKVSVNIDGQRVNVPLTPEEYVEYQRIVGQSNAEEIGNLINNEWYQSLPDEDKVDAILGIQKAVNERAKSVMTGEPANKQRDFIKEIRDRMNRPRKNVLKISAYRAVDQTATNKKGD